MILAGDEALVQFAKVEIRPHLLGPRGRVTSPGAVSLSGNALAEIDCRPPQPIPVRSNAPPVLGDVLGDVAKLINFSAGESNTAFSPQAIDAAAQPSRVSAIQSQMVWQKLA